jgi:DNA polymerase III alpha subunit
VASAEIRSRARHTEEDYAKRLAFEIDVITRMKYPGCYFLIVSDFIKWAKNHGIPVGPGRGSGAGSLVAYALTITDLDPMLASCVRALPQSGARLDAGLRHRLLSGPR